jgi:hypothetical protein
MNAWPFEMTNTVSDLEFVAADVDAAPDGAHSIAARHHPGVTARAFECASVTGW